MGRDNDVVGAGVLTVLDPPGSGSIARANTRQGVPCLEPAWSPQRPAHTGRVPGYQLSEKGTRPSGILNRLRDCVWIFGAAVGGELYGESKSDPDSERGHAMTTIENRPNSALLVEKARREQVPVVWVQHSDEQLARRSDDWRIVPELTPDDAEPLVPAHINGL